MDIIIGKTAGFCFGVANAVTKAEKQTKGGKKIYCLGELVHNNEVIRDLEHNGISFVEDIQDAKGRLIIRAHGAPKEIYEQAKENNIELIDLTCPKVLKIHDLVKAYKKNGYYIFLIGQAKHPEVIGTISYCGKTANIIERIEDLDEALREFRGSGKRDLVVICQTTINLHKFEEIASEVQRQLDSSMNIEIINTICDATMVRQKETYSIARQVELMIIIGGKSSSNTHKLYEIARKNCKNVIIIETKKELEANYLKGFNKIGVMAGASTPKESIEEVVEFLNQV